MNYIQSNPVVHSAVHVNIICNDLLLHLFFYSNVIVTLFDVNFPE